MDTGRDATRPLAWARVPDAAPAGAVERLLGALGRAPAPTLAQRLAGDGPAACWETLVEEGLEWEELMGVSPATALARVRTARAGLLTATNLATLLPPGADVRAALAAEGAWFEHGFDDPEDAWIVAQLGVLTPKRAPPTTTTRRCNSTIRL